MSRRSIATLYGLIRLLPDSDCIGISVFHVRNVNHFLVAETDSDLRITRFLELYPDQEYYIEPLPPFSDLKRQHSIGDASPIPFVVDGEINIILGDRHPGDVPYFPVKSHQAQSVVLDLQRLLSQARDGFFRLKEIAWRSDNFRAGFSDIFEEPPNNSRYWVSRYRLAITQSKSQGTFSPAIADEFRLRGNRWLALFGSKTDYSRLLMFFDKADDGVYAKSDIAANLFGFLCHKLATQQFQFLERLAIGDQSFLSLLPGGLYYFYLEHGFPKLSFKYKTTDVLGEFKARLYQASSDFKTTKAKGLAFALFGERDCPSVLLNQIADLRSTLFSEFHFLRDWIEEQPYEASDSEIFRISAFRLVRAFDALADLESIEYGNARLTPRIYDYLAQDKDFVDRMRLFLAKIPHNPMT